MQLSKKQKGIFEFVSALLKSMLKFEHFHQNDDPHSWYISKITKSEKRG